jgi:hypothetical protein
MRTRNLHSSRLPEGAAREHESLCFWHSVNTKPQWKAGRACQNGASGDARFSPTMDSHGYGRRRSQWASSRISTWQDGGFSAAHFVGHYRLLRISKIGDDLPISKPGFGVEIYMSFAASLDVILAQVPAAKSRALSEASALTCGSRHVPQQ